MKHTPVLLQQAIDGLNIKSGGKYIDATYGLGGHSKVILSKGGYVLGIDWDPSTTPRTSGKNIKLVCGNYAEIEKIARENDFYPVDGVLFDLGLSMSQISNSKRGFSYQRPEEILDMRISDSLNTTAADILNNYSEKKIYEIFINNAEAINIRPIIADIIRRRRYKKIVIVGEFTKIIDDKVANFESNQRLKKQLFQALRIEINHEFENIRQGLIGSKSILNKDGRIAIISFHMSEDRLIKKVASEIKLRPVNKKPTMAQSNNKFERSAKLRIYEKI